MADSVLSGSAPRCTLLLVLLLFASTTLALLQPNEPDQSVQPSEAMGGDSVLSQTDIRTLLAGPKATTDWLQTFGPRSGAANAPDAINSVRMTGVEVDSAGDIFVTGSFLGDVTIGGHDLYSGVRRHGFIGKVAANGVWEWVVSTEDGSNQTGNAQFDGITSDGSGTLYAYGWMNGQIDLNNSQLIITSPGSLQSGGINRGGLITKLDTSGVFDWAVTIDGSTGNDIVNDIAIRSDGLLYVVGQYHDAAMFNETLYSQDGNYNGFFGILNPNNRSFAWIRTIGNPSHDYADNVTQVEVDAFDNAIIAGYYSDNAGTTFGQGHLSFAGRPRAIFIANISSSNNFNWVSTANSGTTSSPSGITALIKYGDTFVVAGFMAGVVTFDSGVSLTANGTSWHTFVGQITAAGDWLFSVRSDSRASPSADYASWQLPSGISVDSNGLVAVTGQFDEPNTPFISNATFGNVEIADGGSGGYLAAFDLTSRSWKWAVRFGSMGGNDRGVDVSYLPDGRMLTVGDVCLAAWCVISIDGQNISINSYAYGGGILWATYPDTDLDGTPDKDDNCPTTANADQSDIDNDGDGDLCDDDIDDDGINNYDDDCNGPTANWDSTDWLLDRDGDGCHDATEDDDDDADGILDLDDSCDDFTTQHNWTSTNLSDWDSDGCKDSIEDDDDDSDGVPDGSDLCPTNPSWKNWTSDSSTDLDSDGCHDDGEDSDDDGDGILDDLDACYRGEVGWTQNSSTDFDGDGCRDDVEDLDDDNDGVVDVTDRCPTGATGWTSIELTDNDGDGCRDVDEDDDDDDDGLLDNLDSCPDGRHGWTSGPASDRDGDGCKDEGPENSGHGEDEDDDGDQKHDGPDDCPRGVVGWISSGATDVDGDGCKDDGEDPDDDNDGFNEDNGDDHCPGTPLGDFVDGFGCSVSQGDSDGDGVDNLLDACPDEDATGWDENADGCIDDIDGDGVKDDVDECIAFPEGSPVGVDGCSDRQRDDDGDGATGDTHPQGDDQCPDTYANETAISFGCSQRQLDGMRDDDEDGVNNLDDICPATPGDDLTSTGGSGVDEDGCSYTQRDADGDGVANSVDSCPGTQNLHQVDAAGCSASQLSTDSEGVSSGLIIAGFAGGAVVIIGSAIGALVLLKKKKGDGGKGRAKKPRRSTVKGPETSAAGLDAVSEMATADDTTAAGVSVDEHGTEWFTDETGVWWYKTPEMADWALFES